MQLLNPIQMNDWEIKKFLKVILSIQLALWGLMGLDAMGFHIPIVRQVISSIYLFIIPGILLLRTLRLHKLGSTETLLYSVSLSIATIMFTGLSMNTVYPHLGISRPISTGPLVVTMSIIVLLLSIISYIRDRDFADPDYIALNSFLSPPTLFLILLPLIAILGAELVNIYVNNIILMLLIVLIAATVILISCDRFIPRNLYPLAIFVIGLSLIFQRSLISMYITGFDIHDEYHLANLVITNGKWDTTIPIVYNTMLSVTMLAPFDSIISNMSLTWVFKIMYPVLLAVIPLGLFRVFQKQTNDKIAFLAGFFFILPYQFHSSMPLVLRQVIASLFIVSFASLVVGNFAMRTTKAILLLIFSASMAISHYGLSYIYMFILVVSWPMVIVAENTKVYRLINISRLKLSRLLGEKPHVYSGTPDRRRITANLTIVFFSVAFAFTWYMFVGQAVVLNGYVSLIKYIASGINDFLNPDSSQALALMAYLKPDVLSIINIATIALSQVFIVLGVLALLLGRRGLRFNREYSIFSILSLGLILAVVFVPLLSASASLGRLTNVVFIFLAPFAIIGGIESFRAMTRLFKVPWSNSLMKKSLLVVSLYLVAFFLFQTGFIWELARQNWLSPSISQKSIELYGNIEMKADLVASLMSEQDVFGAIWLSNQRSTSDRPNNVVYATYNDIRVHPLVSYGMIPMSEIRALERTLPSVHEDAYVYLQYTNVILGIGTEYNTGNFGAKAHSSFQMRDLTHIYENKNRVYTNGGSEIFK